MEDGNGPAHYKLRYLHERQASLDDDRDSDFQARQSEVEVHQRVDERVEHHKDPDGRALVSDAAPHAHHGPCVVVALQKAGRSPLEQDDGRVDNLIELGYVEPPPVER